MDDLGFIFFLFNYFQIILSKKSSLGKSLYNYIEGQSENYYEREGVENLKFYFV